MHDLSIRLSRCARFYFLLLDKLLVGTRSLTYLSTRYGTASSGKGRDRGGSSSSQQLAMYWNTDMLSYTMYAADDGGRVTTWDLKGLLLELTHSYVRRWKPLCFFCCTSLDGGATRPFLNRLTQRTGEHFKTLKNHAPGRSPDSCMLHSCIHAQLYSAGQISSQESLVRCYM